MEREALGDGDRHRRALVAEADETDVGSRRHTPLPTIEDAIDDLGKVQITEPRIE
jgi:hypothetical protein